jgi:hypothetical protein
MHEKLAFPPLFVVMDVSEPPGGDAAIHKPKLISANFDISLLKGASMVPQGLHFCPFKYDSGFESL